MTRFALSILLLGCLAIPSPAQEPTLALTRSDRFVAYRSDRHEGLEEAVASEVVSRLRLDTRGVTILEALPGRAEALAARLQATGTVDFAGPTYFAGTRDVFEARYILTRDLVVRITEGADIREVAALADVELVRSIRGLPGAHVLRVPKGGDALAAVARLSRRPDVVYAHADWLRYLGVRSSVPNDPLFPNQWHLHNTGQGGGLVGLDIRATQAWNVATGAGTTIAIIDTGVDPSHVDLQQTIGFNPVTGAGPTAGSDTGSHGTSCAGVAAASGMNGWLLTGVAHAATIMPIRLLSGYGFGTPSEEAMCFTWAANNGADVISNSWGPDGIPFHLPPVVEQAFIHVTTTGRGGLGCPIFWAAGNGNEDVAADEYVSSAYTISVGAVTNLGLRASYSDYGDALDVVAPSSGGTRNINTLVPGNFHSLNFGGTSASAPQAAGVAALMLEANPTIAWNEIRDAIRISARQVGVAASAYVVGHNPFYGHGLLDAEAAITQAAAHGTGALRLNFSSNFAGHLAIDITNMAPFNEWLIAMSLQPHSPLGSGPFLGIGWDAIATLLFPAGTIPFRSWADVNGGFSYQVSGILGGFIIQGVALELLPGFDARSSNCAELLL